MTKILFYYTINRCLRGHRSEQQLPPPPRTKKTNFVTDFLTRGATMGLKFDSRVSRRSSSRWMQCFGDPSDRRKKYIMEYVENIDGPHIVPGP